MRVRNNTESGVFVNNYGVVPAGDEATVRESPAVKQLIKDGSFSEVKATSGGTSSSNDGGDQ
jgi:hypothetical protein